MDSEVLMCSFFVMARKGAALGAPDQGEVGFPSPPRNGHDKEGHSDEQLNHA